jgi:hypothetical protein
MRQQSANSLSSLLALQDGSLLAIVHSVEIEICMLSLEPMLIVDRNTICPDERLSDVVSRVYPGSTVL